MSDSDAPPARPLVGRVAVVTGAGSGIGRAVAVALAGHGALVVAAGRRRAPLDDVVAEIEAAGGDARAVPCDVGTVAGVDALAAAIADLADPSILINAAGMFGPLTSVIDAEPDEWIRTLAVNTVAAFLTSRRFAPGMLAQRWGRILNVSSAAALHEPGRGNSAYAVSKVALNQFTRNLAAELAGTGVTANVFHPGDVQTEMFEDISRKAVGPHGDDASGYAHWIEWVGRSGGDPVSKAADLVMRVVGDVRGGPNGEFLWIEDPLQAPIASWPAPGQE